MHDHADLIYKLWRVLLATTGRGIFYILKQVTTFSPCLPTLIIHFAYWHLKSGPWHVWDLTAAEFCVQKGSDVCTEHSKNAHWGTVAQSGQIDPVGSFMLVSWAALQMSLEGTASSAHLCPSAGCHSAPQAPWLPLASEILCRIACDGCGPALEDRCPHLVVH